MLIRGAQRGDRVHWGCHHASKGIQSEDHLWLSSTKSRRGRCERENWTCTATVDVESQLIVSRDPKSRLHSTQEVREKAAMGSRRLQFGQGPPNSASKSNSSEGAPGAGAEHRALSTGAKQGCCKAEALAENEGTEVMGGSVGVDRE